MSEVTDLTAAVKALTAQLKKGSSKATAERKKEAVDKLESQIELEERLAAGRIDRAKDEMARKKEYIAIQEKVVANLKRQYELETDPTRKAELEDSIVRSTETLALLTDEQENYIESTKKAKKAQEEQTQAFKAGAAEADNLLNGFLGLSGEGARFFQILGNGTTSLAGFVGGLAKSVVTGDLLVKGLQKLIGNSINFAFELDRQNAAFKAATGAGNEFSDVIGDAGSEYLTFGVNAADAGRATTALFGSFRDFTNLSKSEQTNIAETAAILEKFGVSSAQTGQILDQATKSLYMNSQQAEALTREAATLAISIGKPVSEVASDLASAAPKLAFYGQQMFDVFAQLERQSKATGLSVDSLLGVVGEKFDTFEGAGQAVGRL